MENVIDINPILDLAKWCDLITKDGLSNDLPRCYGYSDECDICEVEKYLSRIDSKYKIKSSH